MKMAITLKHLVVFVFICFFVTSSVHSHTKIVPRPGDGREQKVICFPPTPCQKGGSPECDRWCRRNWLCPGLCTQNRCCCHF
ncbi:hypothetical protein EUTSA_v10023786mg [Eutrema salsugineum]|uniref:Knottin scorpion toxin-like domain-containing protein n=1 Tax=Eutrema salsugineum TaxID=72664 RepID=V4KGF5_EUTSA|nr:hypothetical protein EUTSA_v10023786mg [Eutrema salsugineum]